MAVYFSTSTVSKENEITLFCVYSGLCYTNLTYEILPFTTNVLAANNDRLIQHRIQNATNQTSAIYDPDEALICFLIARRELMYYAVKSKAANDGHICYGYAVELLKTGKEAVGDSCIMVLNLAPIFANLNNSGTDQAPEDDVEEVKLKLPIWAGSVMMNDKDDFTWAFYEGSTESPAENETAAAPSEPLNYSETNTSSLYRNIPKASNEMCSALDRGERCVKRKDVTHRAMMSETLFVANFPEDTTIKDMTMLFEPFDKLLQIDMNKNHVLFNLNPLSKQLKPHKPQS